jgi:hypothetical protein
MLDVLTADALSAAHGFFTRRGGVSAGLYDSLNCGPGSDDRPEAVARNRALATGFLGLAPDRLTTLTQVHSPDVVTLTEPRPDRPRADALVTATPGLVLGVLTADCQPVLFADAQARVIGAAHAGWKGAMAGVLEATVAAMEALGAQADRITAVIGPTISQAAYEVGHDFAERFIDDDPGNARFFAAGPAGKPHFDLPAYGLARLRSAGVGHAEWTRHCTYSDADRFFSYRRTTHRGEPDYGRMLAAIRL